MAEELAEVPVFSLNSERGFLKIFRLTDLAYIVQIDGASFNVVADIDDVTYDSDRLLVNAVDADGAATQFSFNDRVDYDYILDVSQECSRICDLTLSMNSVVRDFYFSGIRSKLGEVKNIRMVNELIKSFANSAAMATNESFFNFDDKSNNNNVSLSSKGNSNNSGNKPKVEPAVSKMNIKCFYCNVINSATNSNSNQQLSQQQSCKFAIHPYNPSSFKINTPIIMCLPCLDNWKEFRDKAVQENELILENEYNEEICSLCSDCPSELVLCSECPRSFCHDCLYKILDEKELKVVLNPGGGNKGKDGSKQEKEKEHKNTSGGEVDKKKDDDKDDWSCMSCFKGKAHSFPSLSKRSWVLIGNNKSCSSNDNINDAHSSSSSSGKNLVNSNINNISSTANISSVKASPRVTRTSSSDTEDISHSSRHSSDDNNNIPDKNNNDNDSSVIESTDIKLTVAAVESGSVGDSKEMIVVVSDNVDSDNAEFINLPQKRKRETDYNKNNNNNGDDGESKTKEQSAAKTAVPITSTSASLTSLTPSSRLQTNVVKVGDKRVTTAASVAAVSSCKNNNSTTTGTITRTSKIDNSVNANSTNNQTNNSSNASDETSTTVTTGTSSSQSINSKPPIKYLDDEVYYFAQYVKFYDNLERACGENHKYKKSTDDSCYLCKDGGELVECDWRRKSGTKGNYVLKCLKVYHQDCLTYQIEENQDWICMRHFCLICGDRKLKFMCKYCSNSLCESCPEKMVEKYGLSKYCEVPTPQTREYMDAIQVIICHSCIELIHRSIQRGELPIEYNQQPVFVTMKRFPGVFDGDKNSTASSIYILDKNRSQQRHAAATTTLMNSSSGDCASGSNITTGITSIVIKDSMPAINDRSSSGKLLSNDSSSNVNNIVNNGDLNAAINIPIEQTNGNFNTATATVMSTSSTATSMALNNKSESIKSSSLSALNDEDIIEMEDAVASIQLQILQSYQTQSSSSSSSTVQLINSSLFSDEVNNSFDTTEPQIGHQQQQLNKKTFRMPLHYHSQPQLPQSSAHLNVQNLASTSTCEPTSHPTSVGPTTTAIASVVAAPSAATSVSITTTTQRPSSSTESSSNNRDTSISKLLSLRDYLNSDNF